MEAFTLVSSSRPSPLTFGCGFAPGDLIDMNRVLPVPVSCFLRCD